ncbi:hypothetical protein H6P81_008877 [Aristolochia fimbriata]|uniref:ATPase AAA-type core domain-containing protein n=1 Tax=Aristolochia fimbriata TaxID=158543 RepID=A0AAV7EJ88_ARIFI|nr:hypothetical protein H6P81_008877 [Aristolochia fimbriata]
MANSTDESPFEHELSTSPSERKTRRRLVQSTLLPCKAPEEVADAGDYSIEGDETEYDGEEACGSRGKKRKRKIQSKASKHASVAIKKSPLKSEQDKNGILNSRSDFFLKASEKRLQQKRQTEQEAVKAEENDGTVETFVSVASKKKSQKSKKLDANVTPCKDMDSSGRKKTEGRRTPSKLTKSSCNKEPQGCQANGFSQSPDKAHAVFDLRLEAKLAAEENARLSAGKQIHPFFSTWKLSKRSQEVIEIDDTEPECPVMQVTLCSSCPPFHIYERHQDDFVSLDWKDWNFSERPTYDSRLSCDLANSYSPLHEGSVEPLKIDSAILSSHGTLSTGKEVHMNKVFKEGENNHDERAQPPALSTSVKQNDKIGLPFQFIGAAGDEGDEQEDSYLVERTTSTHFPCCSWPKCSLWTNKYRPEKALEVCGNRGPVKSLSEWLESWHESVPQASASSVHGSECSWSQSDSEIEDPDEGSPVNNVFLVTGPIGSGKSAAIYACAKEHGFDVIEVNASDCRNGVFVKQKFGEAMKSHGFNEWPHGSQRSQRSCSSSRCSPAASQDFHDGVAELASTCGQPQGVNGRSGNTQERRTWNKSLILFEDVDIVFDEDRGFIGTMLQLAETAQRPMILTCSSKDPSLPHVLERLAVDFKFPSVRELLSGVEMVCAAERLNLSPQILERFVCCCQGDIRKTIMLLQFWCQGGQVHEGMEVKSMYSPLQFDIDAGHLVLPRLVPWGFTHELSNVVEREISKLSSLVKREDFNFDRDCSGSQTDKSSVAGFSAKKEIMLRRNSEQDIAAFSSQSAFSGEFINDFSSSPVTFPRRTQRCQFNSVLSSDSGDECSPTSSSGNPSTVFKPSLPKQSQQCNGLERCITAISCSEDSDHPRLSEFPTGDANNHTWPNVSRGYIDQSIGDHVDMELSTDDKCYLAVTSNRNHLETSETEMDCCTYKAHNIIDVSYVPESSFVPETEICNGDDPPGRVRVSALCCDVSLNDVSLNDASISQSAMNVNNPKKTVSEIDHGIRNQLENTAVGSAPVYGDELRGDHLIDEAEAVSRACPVMDECSRVDFTAGFTLSEPQSSASEANRVQDTWTMLRRCGNLKSYVTSEEKVGSRVVEIISGFTDLISEADVLLSCCQHLINDNEESIELPYEDPPSVSWDDEQLEMTSTFAEHGFCLYANRTAMLASELGYHRKVDLSREMLACSTNPMALGKLVKYELCLDQVSPALETMSPGSGISLQRENEETLYRTIVPIVPQRLQLALKGSGFHEYLSSLSQLCKSEALHSVDSVDRRKRGSRARIAPDYVSAIKHKLSPEEVQLLAQKFCFQAAHPGSNS